VLQCLGIIGHVCGESFELRQRLWPAPTQRVGHRDETARPRPAECLPGSFDAIEDGRGFSSQALPVVATALKKDDLREHDERRSRLLRIAPVAEGREADRFAALDLGRAKTPLSRQCLGKLLNGAALQSSPAVLEVTDRCPSPSDAGQRLELGNRLACESLSLARQAPDLCNGCPRVEVEGEIVAEPSRVLARVNRASMFRAALGCLRRPWIADSRVVLDQRHVPNKVSAGGPRTVQGFLAKNGMPAVPAYELLGPAQGADHPSHVDADRFSPELDRARQVLTLLPCTAEAKSGEASLVVEDREIVARKNTARIRAGREGTVGGDARSPLGSGSALEQREDVVYRPRRRDERQLPHLGSGKGLRAPSRLAPRHGKRRDQDREVERGPAHEIVREPSTFGGRRGRTYPFGTLT